MERSRCERYGRSATEQQVNIKFCYKLGKTVTEKHEMLVQVYGTEAVSRKCVYDFFLFHRLKSIMKGARFADVAAIQERVNSSAIDS